MKRSLPEYWAWRDKLIPLENETILRWIIGYGVFDHRDSIKPGQYYKIKKVREPLLSRSTKTCDMFYDLVHCSKNGKEFKRTTAFSVEGLAKFIEDGTIEIIL